MVSIPLNGTMVSLVGGDRDMRTLLLAGVLWLQALAASRRARWEGATAAVAESLRLTRSMPYPYMAAATTQRGAFRPRSP
jgi:hypothetical protein